MASSVVFLSLRNRKACARSLRKPRLEPLQGGGGLGLEAERGIHHQQAAGVHDLLLGDAGDASGGRGLSVLTKRMPSSASAPLSNSRLSSGLPVSLATPRTKRDTWWGFFTGYQ